MLEKQQTKTIKQENTDFSIVWSGVSPKRGFFFASPVFGLKAVYRGGCRDCVCQGVNVPSPDIFNTGTYLNRHFNIGTTIHYKVVLDTVEVGYSAPEGGGGGYD